MSPRRLRRLAFAVAAAAALVCLYVAARIGFGAILQAMGDLGWFGFAMTVALHLGVICVTGLAWWNLGRRHGGGRLRCFIWGRVIRDSASECLPFSQLGGIVLGARAATLCGVPGTFSAASSVVDITMELVARVPYMLLGLGMLAWLRPHEWLVLPALGGTLVAAIGAGLFFSLQSNGAAWVDAAISKLGAKLAPDWASGRGKAGALQPIIRAIHKDRRTLATSMAIHIVGWVLSGVEVALPLWLMGIQLSTPLGIREGIIIDCAVSAIRSAGFALPNIVGLQEGAFVVVCAMFGIDAHVALALSLLRRGRDFAIGIPALLAWQLHEGQSALKGADPLALEQPALDARGLAGQDIVPDGTARSPGSVS
jgi:glycosyltransferase 2 family protein